MENRETEQHQGNPYSPPSDDEDFNKDADNISFIFPANLSDIDFPGGGFSAFGIHAGGHPEGLDHLLGLL